jgi:type IV/VI secretion system ImpK/VasF family protein
MKHEFEVAALPVFLEVLALCDRAASGTAGPVETEHARLKMAFDSSSAKMLGSSAAEWGLAHYALVALADELLIVDVPWHGQAWWENHALEVNLQGTRARATEFYTSADRAVSLPPSDVMGIYVAAVVAGFRGMYRDNPQGLQSWLHAHGDTLFWQVHRAPPPPTSPDVPGAPPLRGTSQVLLQSLLTTLLLTTLMISVWWAFGLR